MGLCSKNNYVYDPNLDDFTNIFLAFISDRSSLSTFEGGVTRQDFIHCWWPCWEKTSSLLLGRHFGRYKAAARSHTLSELHASFLYVSLLSSICLNWWTNGLTVMIEKVEGVIWVDKLRSLLLMETDFNSLNKLIFSSRMIKSSEEKDRMPEELFGGWQNVCAQLVVVNRRLIMDTFRQKCHSGAIVGVDTAQCYDSVVHSLSILLCQKEGAPLSSLMMIFGGIQSIN